MKIASWLYKLIAEGRNLLYDKGICSIKRIPVPVISVGNLTAGGTGKTPFTIFLTKLLLEQGKSVAILTRGYGRGTHRPVCISADTAETNVNITGDEPALLHRHLKNVPVIIDARRTRGAETALRKFSPDVLIMDDGFQHRRIYRDLDILLWDATTPKNHWDYLPHGRLREGFKNLKRASLLVITRSDIAGDCPQPPQIEEYNSRFFTKTIYSEVLLHSDQEGNLFVKNAKGKKVLAFAGIGNPKPFFDYVKKIMNIVGARQFSDHHHYNKKDMDILSREMKNLRADFAVTTEKDVLNIKGLIHDFPLYYLGYMLEIEEEKREDFLKILKGVFS